MKAGDIHDRLRAGESLADLIVDPVGEEPKSAEPAGDWDKAFVAARGRLAPHVLQIFEANHAAAVRNSALCDPAEIHDRQERLSALMSGIPNKCQKACRKDLCSCLGPCTSRK